ncbi:hypothetical protein AVEN_246765-1 [Araneus ventricosus]|uniref:Uncharacterized protein n=1 Tax=Araneus ventricosus TaxID=182803 RepID=A0A4Y2QYP5_ARAVE|nr:hypothetical protein AVEN_246765-1 [Araneus ventricosus]
MRFDIRHDDTKFFISHFLQTQILDSPMPFSDFTAESIVKTEWSNPLQKFLYTSFPPDPNPGFANAFSDFTAESIVKTEWSNPLQNVLIPHFPRPKSVHNHLSDFTGNQ